MSGSAAEPPGAPLRRWREGTTEVLQIDREHAGNALSAAVLEALETALAQAREDRDLRCLVITGAGERFFAAGGDIKEYRALLDAERLRASFARPRRLLDQLEALPIPVIGAVNGFALGGGAELLLACDLRLAAAGARIGFPYVHLSLMPGWHGTGRLVRACGHAAAQRLLLTGEVVDAREARRLGLVHDVVEEGPVLAAALALGERLATHAPLSHGAIKRGLAAVATLAPAAARAVADAEFERLWLADDHREAEAAFAEKRPPRFTGR